MNLRKINIIVCAILIGIGISLFGVYQASRQVPDFYQEALQTEMSMTSENDDDLEKQVIDLKNEVRHEGYWQELFTADRINQWLTRDLPENFPGLIPKKIKDPRVAIEKERALVACRYQDRRVNTVLSLTFDAYLTEDRNTVAIRFFKARAGLLPVPMKKVLDTIDSYSERAKLRLRWTQDNGDPVALITIPDKHKDRPGTFELKAVEFHEDGLRIAGQTFPSDSSVSSRKIKKAGLPESRKSPNSNVDILSPAG